MSLSTSPALNANNTVTLIQNTKLDGLSDAPFQTLVHIELPVGGAEIRLGFREEERVHATRQVSVA